MWNVKHCRKCDSFKSRDEFWKCAGTPDGLQYDCISCMQQHWKEKLETKRKLPPKTEASVTIKALMRSARKRARRDRIEFTITDKDIKLVDTCPIRGVKLVRHQGKISPDNYSLDRRDNSKGYVPGNVFIISWMANQAKSSMNIEQLERLLRYAKGEL